MRTSKLMYTPDAFKESRTEVLHELVRKFPLATLVIPNLEDIEINLRSANSYFVAQSLKKSETCDLTVEPYAASHARRC